MANLAGTSYPIIRAISNKLTSVPATLPPLGPHDVLLKITHSGVCFTDYEFHRFAPLALGHEGVGTVIAIGSSVTTLRIGDRAGGGFHRDSCGTCRYCLTGRDIMCDNRTIYGQGDFDNGTFGTYFVGKEGHVHKIPEGMSSEDAAPLQCAGATVYAALTETVKSGERVGIMGVGGLGHLAVQFARKMGAEVVVFSTSRDKEEEARGFGASEFVLLDEIEKVSRPVDVVVLTANKYPDWGRVMQKGVLARGGTVVPLAAPTHGPISLPADKMLWDMYNLHSTLVASKAKHDEMLEFAYRNEIKPAVQVYKFEGPQTVEDVFQKLVENKVRYRAVLEFP